MTLNDFEVKKNKQRPNEVYSYLLKDGPLRFTIFTVNSGRTYSSTVEMMRGDGRYYTEESMKGNDLNEAIVFFQSFIRT